MKIKILIVVLVFSFYSEAQKIKGISFVAAPVAIDESHIKPLVEVNANWVSIMPYGFIKDNQVLFDSEFQWYGEKTKGCTEAIQLCHEAGLKVMLKPQIWIPGGFTGDYECNSNEDWQTFEKSYGKFILSFAKVAQENDVELFCIGTEWKKFTEKRTAFWRELIKVTKTLYSGKLTYAANWNEFHDIHFWESLDYIGIDAYFPLAKSSRTNFRELKKSWDIINEELAVLSKEKNKKIIFTEIGYRSIKEALIEPWESSKKGNISKETQLIAYRALFENVWNKDWLEGLFIWKWHHDSGENNSREGRFTPQNKPAEAYLKSVWSN